MHILWTVWSKSNNYRCIDCVNKLSDIPIAENLFSYFSLLQKFMSNFYTFYHDFCIKIYIVVWNIRIVENWMLAPFLIKNHAFNFIFPPNFPSLVNIRTQNTQFQDTSGILWCWSGNCWRTPSRHSNFAREIFLPWFSKVWCKDLQFWT